MEKLELIIMPSFDSVRESMGYEENEDYDTDAILYKQGYYTFDRDVSDNEIFEIGVGYIGRINSEGEFYLLTDKEELLEKEDYPLENDLIEGKYQFSAKDHVIYVLDEVDDEFDDNLEETGPEKERIYNLITDSAKSRFDYASFTEELCDELADYFLFEIMVSLAIGESKELIASKLNCQLMIKGYVMEIDNFVHFIEDREKDLTIEILALKIAKTNLDDGADPQAVYLQTEEFLFKMKKKN